MGLIKKYNVHVISNQTNVLIIDEDLHKNKKKSYDIQSESDCRRRLKTNYESTKLSIN